MHLLRLCCVILLTLFSHAGAYAVTSPIQHSLLDVERYLLLYGCTGSEYFLGHLQHRQAQLRERLAAAENASALLDILELYDAQADNLRQAFTHKDIDRQQALRHALQVAELFTIYLPSDPVARPDLADHLRALARLEIRQACAPPPATPNEAEAERLLKSIELQLRDTTPGERSDALPASWRYLQVTLQGPSPLLYPFNAQIEKLLEQAANP